jgi:hypothetical protein
MGAVCINLHQRSAIRAWVGFIDPLSFKPGRTASKDGWRRGSRAPAGAERIGLTNGCFLLAIVFQL